MSIATAAPMAAAPPTSASFRKALEHLMPAIGYVDLAGATQANTKFSSFLATFQSALPDAPAAVSSIWAFTGTMRRRDFPNFIDMVVIAEASLHRPHDISYLAKFLSRICDEARQKTGLRVKGRIGVYTICGEEIPEAQVEAIGKEKETWSLFGGTRVGVQPVAVDLARFKKHGELNNVADDYVGALLKRAKSSHSETLDLEQGPQDAKEVLGETITAASKVFKGLRTALNPELIAYRIRSGQMTYKELAILVIGSTAISLAIHKLFSIPSAGEELLGSDPDDLPIIGSLINPLLAALVYLLIAAYVFPFFRLFGGVATFRETAFAVVYVFSLIGPIGTLFADVKQVTGLTVGIEFLLGIYLFPILAAVNDAHGKRATLGFLSLILVTFGLIVLVAIASQQT